MSVFQLHWAVSEEWDGVLLRTFLQQKHISKAALVDIKYNGGRIEVNGKEENVRYSLKEGDRVVVSFPREQTSEGLIPEKIPLSIIYEDDYFLILNKPPFMNTIPSREHPRSSMANAIAGYYEEKGFSATVHIVTRLDRDTSGLMLVAKNRHVHHLMSQEQKKGHVSRLYEALIHGQIDDSGRIEQPIARKSTSIIEREVCEDGQYACTLYQCIEKHAGFSHVHLKLLTGRTHQIRVHMAHIGHPLLGDTLYGGSDELINRQALHCKQISFYHPFLDRIMIFEAEMDQDMKNVLADIR
ncbi:RluA family pseudouridine synthase [Bacillus testis]|uniref:RluA family pseudouridine synthase n=1 Tax=Bacillus testis TaxID=1622072 RepID=UPI00067EBA7A|nr:RluA family pseudouridine synthase [Bacillus testis]